MLSRLLRTSYLLLLVCAAARAFPNLPVYFEPDHSQFVARTPQHTLFLSATGAVLDLKGHAPVRMTLAGASQNAMPQGVDRVRAVSNYFTGNDPAKWRTAVPQFAKVRYQNVYPGIDVVYYGNERDLEYDFIVAPGADPGLIDVAYKGARTKLAANGGLLIESDGLTIRQNQPHIYQEIDGKRVAIAGGYRLQPDGHAHVALASYDHSRQLIIDPVIQLSVYLGAAGYDAAFAIAVDEAGNSYITGNTNAITFPTSGSAQEFPGGGGDAFVAKFGPQGNQIFITYLGGKQNDAGNGIAVDSQHNIYVSGVTSSTEFPVLNAAQRTFGGGEEDAFVTKLSPGGDKIVYSTYVGGGANDFGNGIAVDSAGSAYIAGWTRSSDFPAQNSFQSGPSGGGEDVFVTKVSPAGSSFTYSTFVGGNGRDFGTGIAVDATGAAYVTGSTTSSVFPAVNALQAKNAGFSDAFLFKLTPAGNELVFSTFFGGTGDDTGFRIALDSSGIYVVGYTSSINFPLLNAAQTSIGGGSDAFVSKISLSGASLLYSTYLGGSGEDYGYGIAVDSGGSAYVAGWTSSPNFPSRNPVQVPYGGGASDAFIARLTPAGNAFLYSSFLGGAGDDEAHGIGLDASGLVFVAGRTSSAGFPGARNQYSEGTGKFDAFITRISADSISAFAVVSPAALVFSGTNAVPQTLALTSSGPSLNFAAFASSSGNWLSITPANGTGTPAALAVSVSPAGLGSGTFPGTITINVPGASNSPIIVPVSYTITQAPAINSITPSSINAGITGVTITVAGSGFTSSSSVSVNGAAVGTIFVDSSTLRAIVPPSQLASVGNLSVIVSGPTGSSAAILLSVTENGLSVLSANVVNAATFQSGPVAPGEIITIFGSGFGPPVLTGATIDSSGLVSTLAGETRVLFDGAPAPVIYATNGQISAIVPYSVAAVANIPMQVEYQGRRSAPVVLAAAPSAPGVFTVNASGRGQAVAINEDGTANSASNPAAKGSVIVLYATGEGQTAPGGIDGKPANDPNLLPKPVLPVRALINGLPADILYSGAAPGLVAGMMQLNVRVPSNTPAASGLPIIIDVGGVISRQDVTIAVK